MMILNILSILILKKNDKNAIVIDEETLKKLIVEDKIEESIPPSIEHLYI